MDIVVNRRVASAICKLFDCNKDSDCVIKFYIPQTEPCKRQLLEVGAPTGSAHKLTTSRLLLGDPIRGHQFVLRYASDLFAVQLEGWGAKRPLGLLSQDLVNDESLVDPGPQAQQQPDPSAPAHAACGRGGASASSTAELLVPLGSEEEIPSARAAIAFAYTGQVQAGSIRDALKVRRQGAYMQIDGCAAACDEVIKSKLASSGTQASGGAAAPGASCSEDRSLPVLDLYADWALWHEAEAEPSFCGALATAKPLLVAHFGDALAALNTASLNKQLLALPAVGLEALLESDEFGTDNESSVLLLLATWMRANYDSTDAQIRERLCRRVRLVQLSRPYLSLVLPALALDFETVPQLPAGWFPVGVMEAAFITSFASAQACEREALERAGSKFLELHPFTYQAGPRPQCIPKNGRSFTWHVGQQKLKEELEELRPGYISLDFDPDIVSGGFQWTPRAHYTHGEASGGLFVHCQLPPAFMVAGSRLFEVRKLPAAVVPLDAGLVVHHWKDGVRKLKSVEFTGARDQVPVGSSWGYKALLPLRQHQPAGSTDGDSGGPLAAWSEYLRDGKITGTMMLRRAT